VNRFYIKSEDQLPNVRHFGQLVQDLDLDLFWPNQQKAPWHVQFKVGVHGPRPQVINAWPHLLKAYWDREGGPVVGAAAIVDLVIRATDYAYERDGVILVEDDDAPPVS
jgi:hypothetical protein